MQFDDETTRGAGSLNRPELHLVEIDRDCPLNAAIERVCYWLLIPILALYGIACTGAWL